MGIPILDPLDGGRAYGDELCVNRRLNQYKNSQNSSHCRLLIAGFLEGLQAPCRA